MAIEGALFMAQGPSIDYTTLIHNGYELVN